MFRGTLSLCIGILAVVFSLEGCSVIGYHTGKCCDRWLADSVSIPPSIALPDLEKGDAVQCVLKDSSRIGGTYAGTGLWRNGDSLRFLDGTTIVPIVWHRDGTSPPEGEFFGLRIRTNSGISVVDSRDILSVLGEEMPTTFRLILTILGGLIDVIVSVGAGMGGAAGAY